MYKDFFGPKAIYLGEDVSPGRTPPFSVQVNVLLAGSACVVVKGTRLTELEIQDLQNRLMGYRLKNLSTVYLSDFNASALTSDTGAVASALGACIVDSPGLQSETSSLCSRQLRASVT